MPGDAAEGLGRADHTCVMHLGIMGQSTKGSGTREKVMGDEAKLRFMLLYVLS